MAGSVLACPQREAYARSDESQTDAALEWSAVRSNLRDDFDAAPQPDDIALPQLRVRNFDEHGPAYRLINWMRCSSSWASIMTVPIEESEDFLIGEKYEGREAK